MSADRDFILKEMKQIDNALDLIDPLLVKPVLDQYESIMCRPYLKRLERLFR